MAEGVVAERTLDEHRAIADRAVGLAIGEAIRNPFSVAERPDVHALRSADADTLRSIVITLLDRAIPNVSAAERFRRMIGRGPDRHDPFGVQYAASRIIATLVSRRVPWTRGDARLVLELVNEILRRRSAYDEWQLMTIVTPAISAAERAVADGGVAELEPGIRDLAEHLGSFRQYSTGKAAQQRNRLLGLLGSAMPDVDVDVFDGGDSWGRAWRELTGSMTAAQRALVAHLSLVTSVSPTQAWRKQAKALVDADGIGKMLKAMLDDAPSAKNLKPQQFMDIGGETYAMAQPILVDANALLLRGAIWAAAVLDEDWVPEALTAVGLFFGTSGRGDNISRDERLANGAAAALGTLDGTAAIAGLGRLKSKVTNRNVSKQVAKALESAAMRSGVTTSELLELAVPTYGLGQDGRREIRVGDHVAVLTVDGTDPILTWRAPSGSESARPTAALAAAERAAVTSVKEEHKELKKGVALERGRLEELFVEDRSWPLAAWRARYLDHPFTGQLARRLIWSFRDSSADQKGRLAMPSGEDGGLVGPDGSAVRVAEDATVRLWHPIDASEATIAAWRTALMDRQLRQPFKQAFREVYRLTPAEEETGIYSNRFAAHILQYPQARALMTARRWGSNFLGPYDGGYQGTAKRVFPTHNLRAEFFHDAIESGGAWANVEYCSTDQVRFIRLQPTEEPIDLPEVPSIVFSEAMRDVDLFVSVASTGADRNWQDGGRDQNRPMDAYWLSAWDEDLTATAKVRRDVLERLLPGLAIADRLTLLDRWLEVRGDLRMYRIHLGTGNIKMAPSDTYLCIVPGRGSEAERVFLPFDDDLTLTVILSKAFMLAADRKIVDRSIVAQIQRS